MAVTTISPWEFRAMFLMRLLLPSIALVGAGLAAGWVQAQEPTALPAPARPKVYALIAAIGAKFGTTLEVQQTGSHLPPYRRKDLDDAGNLLNRIVLRSLDAEVARADPTAQRILMALDPSLVDAAAPALREGKAIAAVMSALEHMPQRSAWNRILVVTPAYGALERDGLGKHTFIDVGLVHDILLNATGRVNVCSTNLCHASGYSRRDRERTAGSTPSKSAITSATTVCRSLASPRAQAASKSACDNWAAHALMCRP
jgi:hypothetical protein